MTSIATAMQSAIANNPTTATPKTTHVYFDLYEFIQAIHSPEIAAAAAQSTAWRIDTMIINAARQLFRAAAEEAFNSGSFDSIADTKNAFNEQLFAENCFHDIGSHNAGPILTIKELYAARADWIELAQQLTALTTDYKGAAKSYLPKELYAQIRNPAANSVSTETKRKLKINAVRFADAYDAPELATELYEQKLARQKLQSENIQTIMRTQGQGVIYMLELALVDDTPMAASDTDGKFYSLTLDTQHALIDNAIRAIERAADQAAGDRNVKESDYDLICISAIKTVKLLKAVLNNPRFTQRAAEAQAAEKQLG